MCRYFFLLFIFVSSLLVAGPLKFGSERKEQALFEIDHPVSTKNADAQKSFNKGLTNIFVFNHDLAFREFEKASQLDPKLAMAYWGMALALGQNINQDVTPENEGRAYAYIQKALTLLSFASPVEHAYIEALAQRYTDDPSKDLVPLRYIYRNAMKKVTQDYSEDLDAACLYAESILDLDPWKFWTWDGKPEPGILEAIDVLEFILRRNPYHIGANHYYIHAIEESPKPERALLSAFRLSQFASDSGHVLHMPCHIFLLCGYYEEAIKTNQKAVQADRRYIKKYGMDGEYPLHYLRHNIKIMARTYMLMGQYEDAIRSANEMEDFISPHFEKMPDLAKNLILTMEINLYFHRWKEILDLKSPPEQNAIAQTYRHFSRAMAYVNLGDMEEYQTEKNLMLASKQKINPKEEIANNSAIEVFDLSELMLNAAVAQFQKQPSVYTELLQMAVDKQDRFTYDEPPSWYMPIRMQLGEALLEAKRYKEAEEVFKKGLSELQRNGRMLSGLALSLKGQGREWDANWVEKEARKNSQSD